LQIYGEISYKHNYVIAEPHHFYEAPAPGKNFGAAPALTLLYSKENVLKGTKI
jgi:hypothetical protein